MVLMWEPLPAVVGISILLIAAATLLISGRVPNVLTLPAVLAGWAFAAYVDAMHHAIAPSHALLASLLGTFLALLIMLPAYRTFGLGAGCVKAQMAFAAWACAATPFVPALALIICATIAGLVVTFVWLHITTADIAENERHSYAFPAQVTMTVVAVLGVLAYWMISYPTQIAKY